MSLNNTLIGEGATEWWLSTLRKGDSNGKEKENKSPKSKKLVSGTRLPEKRGGKTQIKEDV